MGETDDTLEITQGHYNMLIVDIEDLRAEIAAHQSSGCNLPICVECDDPWPCLVRRLCERMTALSEELDIHADRAKAAERRAARGGSGGGVIVNEELRCTRCCEPIEDGYMIGDGDGTGQRFAHPSCYRFGRRLSDDEYGRAIDMQRIQRGAGARGVVAGRVTAR